MKEIDKEQAKIVPAEEEKVHTGVIGVKICFLFFFFFTGRNVFIGERSVNVES